MTPPPSFRPKQSGVEKSHDSMVHAPWWQEISRLRVSIDPKIFTTIPAGSPARDDDAGRQHTVIPGSKLPKTMPRTPSFRPQQSGVEKSHDSMVHAPGWQEISRLRVSIDPKVFATHTDASPPQGGAQGLAAKGCTRLRVEMIRKGCPDQQTAACLGGVSFEALAVQPPRATLWPSPPRWEACHLILSRLRLPANQVPLPPQGGAWVSGKRVYEAACRDKAQRLP